MKQSKQYREDSRRFDEISEFTKKCKCGHSVILNPGTDKVLCNWCHNYVFKNKKDEDIYRIKEKIRCQN